MNNMSRKETRTRLAKNISVFAHVTVTLPIQIFAKTLEVAIAFENKISEIAVL